MGSARIDISGMTFGEWTVIEYSGNRLWKCKCSCGTIRDVSSYALREGKSTSCGHEIYTDMIGKQFGEWEVVSFSKSIQGNLIWNCRCSCGIEKEVHGNRLKSGRSKSCGHNTIKSTDLIGKSFGDWTVTKAIGKGYSECKCACGTIRKVSNSSLNRGMTLSCGCNSSQIRKDTMIERYGDIVKTKHREKWQIDILESKELLASYILNKGFIPTALELAYELGINTNNIYKRIHSYGLEELVKIDHNSSKYELEICNILKENNIQYIERVRSLLNDGTELDIYIPEKKIAIEFNGNYWHSSIFKDKKYHQNKTVEAARHGIHLIHVFEYEWVNEETKKKIINLILGQIKGRNIVYGRRTHVAELSNDEYNKFLDNTHLQGKAEAKIKIGLFLSTELIGLMSFSKPRFNNNYEWELIRLAWKSDILVIGGAEKLFSYFIKKYKPINIISYCDISKFTGKVYLKLGFKTSKSEITDPNYIWYSYSSKKILSRYQTQKHKLIAQGLGTEGQTEKEIMEQLDYVKIYDSGNLKLTWEVNSIGNNKSNNIS